jgi:hypothetical protein
MREEEDIKKKGKKRLRLRGERKRIQRRKGKEVETKRREEEDIKKRGKRLENKLKNGSIAVTYHK